MANGKRHIGLFGVAGVLLAALIIAGFVFAGNILQAFGKCLLTVQIMDKPVELEHLYLTIASVSIQDENGEWTDLTLEMRDPFDLLALQSASATLSETEVLAGRYHMMRINISSASAVYAGETETSLKITSDVLKVLFEPQLNLEGNTATMVLIDLQPDSLDSIAISNSTNLRPVVKAIVPQSSD